MKTSGWQPLILLMIYFCAISAFACCAAVLASRVGPGVVMGWQPAPDFQTLLRGMNRWLVSSLVARVQQGREAELVYMSCVARCAITKTGIKQAKHGG